MIKLSKIRRLFTIHTRFEAWLAIYAIALGAVERGQHYLVQYHGASGWMLAAACTGIVFVAGAKLLDSVKPAEPAVASAPYRSPLRRRATFGRNLTGRSRPTRQPLGRDSRSLTSRRTD